MNVFTLAVFMCRLDHSKKNWKINYMRNEGREGGRVEGRKEKKRRRRREEVRKRDEMYSNKCSEGN